MNIWHMFLQRFPAVYFFNQILRGLGGGAPTKKIESVHARFRIDKAELCLDIGCGNNPKNLFQCKKVLGLDLVENIELDIIKCHLGFQRIPFDDSRFDYVTAYDVLEHIPKSGDSPDGLHAPFIFLMNEVYRVLKPGGLFVSLTPVYPYLGAFQDPTHNNIMTSKTLELYFSNKKFPIAEHYGIQTNYEILYQKLHEQHLLSFMRKN